MKINKKILLKDLGLKDYKDIWEYQTSLLNRIIDIKRQNRKNSGIPNFLTKQYHRYKKTKQKKQNQKSYKKLFSFC